MWVKLNAPATVNLVPNINDIIVCIGEGGLYSYIVPVNFIDGGNQGARRKPHTCHKSLTNFII